MYCSTETSWRIRLTSTWSMFQDLFTANTGLDKHYIIWMNFNVMSKRSQFGKPLTQCRWFPIQDFILPRSWQGLIGNHIATHIQQYFIQPLIRCHWKLISETAGWTTLDLVFIDRFKKGVSCCFVNRLLIFINN